MLRRIPLTVAAVAAASLVVAPAATAKTTDVKVMTRNVFLGADLPPIALASKGADFEKAAGDARRHGQGQRPEGAHDADRATRSPRPGPTSSGCRRSRRTARARSGSPRRRPRRVMSGLPRA